MTEDWWSDIHFEMSTTPRRVFNQAYLYRQTGSSGIHSHKHKHIQLFVVFFSSSLRDTDDIKRRTFFFSLRRFLICVWRLKMRTRHSWKAQTRLLPDHWRRVPGARLTARQHSALRSSPPCLRQKHEDGSACPALVPSSTIAEQSS